MTVKTKLPSDIILHPGNPPGSSDMQSSHVSHIPSFDPIWQRHISDPTWRLHTSASPSDSVHEKGSFDVLSASQKSAPRSDSGATSSHPLDHSVFMPARAATDSAVQKSTQMSIPVSDSRMVSAPELGQQREAISSWGPAQSPEKFLPRWDSIEDEQSFGEMTYLMPAARSASVRYAPITRQSTEEVVDQGIWQTRRGWAPGGPAATTTSSNSGTNVLAQSWDPVVDTSMRAPRPQLARSARVLSEPARPSWPRAADQPHPHRSSEPYTRWSDPARSEAVRSRDSWDAHSDASARRQHIPQGPYSNALYPPGQYPSSSAGGASMGRVWAGGDFVPGGPSPSATPPDSGPGSPLLPRELPWLQSSEGEYHSTGHASRQRQHLYHQQQQQQQYSASPHHVSPRDASPLPLTARRTSSSLSKSLLLAGQTSARTDSPQQPRSSYGPSPLPHYADARFASSPQSTVPWIPEHVQHRTMVPSPQPIAAYPRGIPSHPQPLLHHVQTQPIASHAVHVAHVSHGSAPQPAAARREPSVPRRPEQWRDTDSPTTKDRYKDFARCLREQEKISYLAAMEYFDSAVATLPERCHFRAFLEMADIAKRDNNINDARVFFQRAGAASPQASQVWLEWAKLEEECGELTSCQAILKQGLQHCPLVEPLLIKGIKHEERLGNVAGARGMLAHLLHSETDKTWRMVAEGAMLEARTGRVGVARLVFMYLVQAVPAHGPVFYDAVRLEERSGSLPAALALAEKGLALVPRYGPLWFAVLKLMEKLRYSLPDLRSATMWALQAVSRELVWKVWYERAQVEARAGLLAEARRAYANAVRFCPPNLRWKIWLGSARTELSDGHLLTARSLLTRAAQEVPRKTRAVVLLERARLEEYDGCLDQAREVLQQGCTEARYEWKIFLEAVLVEYRCGHIADAIQQGQRALECHPGTGRLWALMIQLRLADGEAAQLQMFRKALQQVPKSGEVWCEGARARLNPLSASFDLSIARRFLDFAIQFTPQYGDSFVEYLRLELLQTGSTRAIEDLLRCSVNADPNYGALWCHCKQHFLDDADQVLRAALALIQRELYHLRSLYARALVRSLCKNPAAALCLPCEVVAQPMIQFAHKAGSLCTLCHDPIASRAVVTLACCHSFHEDCAKRWSAPQQCCVSHPEKACPLCSQPWCVVRYHQPGSPSRYPDSHTPPQRTPRDGSSPSSPRLSEREGGLNALTLGMAALSSSRRSSPSLTAAASGSPSRRGSPSALVGGSVAAGSPSLARRPVALSPLVVPVLRVLSEPSGDDDVAGLLMDLGLELAAAMIPSSSDAVFVQPPPPSPAVNATALGLMPHDFVTGLMQVNRDYCKTAQLPPAVRQKLLFGSDFVVP